MVFVLLLLLQGPAAICADAAECRARAQVAAAAGDFETFHDLAWRAVQKGKPNDPESMVLLARAQSLSGRPGDALVMAAIYHRRGDAKGKSIATPGSGGASIHIDRHGRALVDVRAQVRPELEKKIKALGGVVVSTSRTYDSIVGWMPLLTLERLAADRTVRAIEPAQ